jgi:hypothetical protein
MDGPAVAGEAAQKVELVDRSLSWETVWKDSGSPYRGGTQNSSKYRVDVQLVGYPTLRVY